MAVSGASLRWLRGANYISATEDEEFEHELGIAQHATGNDESSDASQSPLD